MSNAENPLIPGLFRQGCTARTAARFERLSSRFVGTQLFTPCQTPRPGCCYPPPISTGGPCAPKDSFALAAGCWSAGFRLLIRLRRPLQEKRGRHRRTGRRSPRDHRRLQQSIASKSNGSKSSAVPRPLLWAHLPSALSWRANLSVARLHRHQAGGGRAADTRQQVCGWLCGGMGLLGLPVEASLRCRIGLRVRCGYRCFPVVESEHVSAGGRHAAPHSSGVFFIATSIQGLGISCGLTAA